MKSKALKSSPIDNVVPFRRTSAPEALVPARSALYPELRYMGSKKRLLPWIHGVLDTLDFESAADGFSETGSVGYRREKSAAEPTFEGALVRAPSTQPTVFQPKVSTGRVQTSAKVREEPRCRRAIQCRVSPPVGLWRFVSALSHRSSWTASRGEATYGRARVRSGRLARVVVATATG